MAKKIKTVFFCSSCGHESAKWLGQCPACREWNTMVEAPAPAAAAGAAYGAARSGTAAAYRKPVPLSAVEDTGEERFSTGFSELDRVLGGGAVAGSMILLGGDPGIGKSTILLQAARSMAAAGLEILYISGEESLRQIKMRAKRIGETSDRLRFLCETDLDAVTAVLQEEKPALAIIDSIQTMYSAQVQGSPGSITQIREATGILLRLAKDTAITFFLVGHVTKEGSVAGPRVLEHMVDAVLYFEGDRYASYRILRSVKNRFGSTNEIGIFEMRGSGLTQVPNPSEFFLSGRPHDAGGSVVTCSMEGTRPLLLEVQALVCRTNYGYPRRQSTGTDYNRVSLLMAVIEKRLGIPMSSFDAYINLAGGIRQTEPALDLGIVLAILSSFRNAPVDDHMIVFGEVGLSGEVRAVSMAQARVQEAHKMGFTSCVLPHSCMRRLEAPEGMRLIPVRSLAELGEVLGPAEKEKN
ncbi:MAG: DNA repair protein RadA [Eubacteriales bacterium]|nr:DNA repair protein RadA [Eubacteriales bacterium]